MNLLGLHSGTLLFGSALLALANAAFSAAFARSNPAGGGAAVAWCWSMGLLGCTEALWFATPSTPAFLYFFLSNSLLVVASVFLWRTFYRLVGSEVGPGSMVWVAALGISGVVAVYGWDLPRALAVTSISASILIACLLPMVKLLGARHLYRLPHLWLALLMLGFMSLAMSARLWVLVSAGSPDAVAPTSTSNVQVLTILATNFLIVAGSIAIFGILAEEQRQLVIESTRRDALTGLYTRGAFFELAQPVLDRPAPTFAVLMIDLDHFKNVNDTYGHAGGDVVLRHAAALVMRWIRSVDLAGRYGGEEMCVLLPGCDAAEAQQVALRLCQDAATAAARLPDGRQVSYTMSIGVAARQPVPAGAVAQDLSAVIDRADQALYRAKHNGRNRVEVDGPGAEAVTLP